MTQERLALRPFHPNAPSKMLEFKHLDTKVMVCMTLLEGRVVFETKKTEKKSFDSEFAVV